MLTRNDKILSHINKDGWGIEIGPSHAPIAPKSQEYKVHVIDYLDKQGLIEKFKACGVDTSNIEEVDFIWSGESYLELTKNSHFYDWIISSHSIEHTTDFVGFLLDCDAVLKEDGVISLAVPDKRNCFDHFRPTTGISKIIDAYYNKAKRHSVGTVVEFHLNFSTLDGVSSWCTHQEGQYALSNSLESTHNLMQHVLKNKHYIDAHAWCFTYHSFRLMIHDLYHLGLIPFQEIASYDTFGNEFHITLGRKGKGIKETRLEMLQLIEAELA